MRLDKLLEGITIEVIGGGILLILVALSTYFWRRFWKRNHAPQATEASQAIPPASSELEDKTMQLLKIMRQQVAGKSTDIVSGSDAGWKLGMEPGTEELNRRMSDLVQAGYLEEIDNLCMPRPTSTGSPRREWTLR
jgi:hypothetical protein